MATERRKNIGRAEANWSFLFTERLRREGRLEAYRAALSAAPKRPGTRLPLGSEVARIRREFGYVSKEDEVDQYERFMIRGSHTKMQDEVKRVQDEIRAEQTQEAFEEIIPDADELNLPPDIAWVYSHPAMLRHVEDLGPHWTAKPEDALGAPSRGSVGMLNYFVHNRRDFYKLVLSHLAKKDTEGGDKDLEDDGKSIAEIEKMLAELE